MRNPNESTRVRGIALVITMAFLVLIAILIVGLSGSVMLDRPSSNSYLEKMRASEFAKMGVEDVVGKLRRYASAFSENGTGNWVSQPGRLIASGGAGSGNYMLTQEILLHSGEATGQAGMFAEPNLNIATFSNRDEALLTGVLADAPVMPVAWIYVRQDGTLDTSAVPDLTNTSNPIVGRYAFWTDDESSKINSNTAWGRSAANTAPGGHPTKVDFTALEGFSGVEGQKLANAIHDAVSAVGNYQFFNSPEDARRVEAAEAGVSDALRASKFDVTHYNHDPNTTFFNEPRIVLTTRPERAGWTFNTNPSYPNEWVGVNGLPSSQWTINSGGKLEGGGRPVYLDIAALKADGEPLSSHGWNLWNPFETVSGTNAISDAKISRAIRVLNSYLRRTDWPMAPGSSFQDRYYSGNSDRLTQLSLNIIDYVRAKECEGDSGTGIIVPIRGSLNTTTGNFTVAINPAGTVFLGIARIPKITEVGIWVRDTPFQSSPSGTPSTLPYDWKVKVELYLPKNFGLSQIDLSNLKLVVQYIHDAQPGVILLDESPVNHANNVVSDMVLRAGERVTITRTMPLKLRFAAATGRPSSGATIPMRFGLSMNGTGTPPRLELAPLLGSTSDLINVPIDGPGVPESDIKTLEVDDPRVNSHKADWKPYAGSGKNSLGQPNSVSTLGQAPSGYSPQQDTDGGVISDASLYMPPPWKENANTALGENPGYVTSAGELGYIHTGIESTAAGVPWRTLHLQPNTQPATEVPDWAFMDLFTAPVGGVLDADFARKEFVYSPRSTSVAGRVNMNASPLPFALARTGPLEAVLKGVSYDSTDPSKTLSAAQAGTIAENIYSKNLASQGKTYGNSDLYDSPGEVVEIRGVADGGEKSEELIRQISNNITARGDVFSVYSVGQALKQTPSGELKVLGEQRLQTMIERFQEENKVRFAPIYFKALNP